RLIVPPITNVGDRQPPELAEVLLQRQEVGQHLRRMILIAKPVPYRYASVLGKRFDDAMGVATKHDAVEHSPEDAGDVFDRLLDAETDVLWTEDFGVRPLVGCRDDERRSRSA